MPEQVQFPVPRFGKMLDQLRAAGLETRNARGSWGGITPAGGIVATAWTDQPAGDGRFLIKRPRTNHGGLKAAWDTGSLRVGTELRLILIHPRGQPAPNGRRQIKDAALMPQTWRVVEVIDDAQAIVERCA
jgi:hypothetical protein